MTVPSVPRWQWLLAGAAAGLLLWAANRPGDPGLPLDGECINDPRTFEHRLLTSVAGRPLFKDVRVSRHRVAAPDGDVRELYLVRGKSCDGTVKPDGKYRWEPTCFVARVPYQPATDLSSLSRRGVPDAPATWQRVRSPTVVDFLRLARQAGGPRFTHAWWDTHPFLTWFGGTLLLVGVVWPCAIDLAVHGRLVRPRTRGRPALPGAPTTTPPPRAPTVPMPGLDEPEDVHRGHHSTTAAPPATPPLQTARVELTPCAAAPTKEFQAKQDDFYPTESRQARPH